MKRNLYIILLFFLPTLVWGEGNIDDICEKVITSDGNEYEGYILNQSLGDEILFFSLISTKIDSTYTGEAITSTFTPKENLDERWLWLIREGRIDYCINDGHLGLMLHSFKTKTGNATSVLVLERNERYIRYIEFSNKNQVIKLRDIKHIEYIYMPGETSQLVDVITFNDKQTEIKGCIVKQIIGKSLSVRDIATNVNIELELKDVKSISKETHNKSMSLYEQSKWIEIVELENGTTIDGIITSKDYGSKNSDAYIVVTTLDNSYKVVKMEDLKSIKRRFNDSYISVPTNVWHTSHALINGVPVDVVLLDKWASKKADILIQNADTIFTDVKARKGSSGLAHILIQTKVTDDHPSILAYKVGMTSDNKLLLWYKDILNHSICPRTEILNNVVLNRFNLELGKYVFYVKETDKAYFVNLVE